MPAPSTFTATPVSNVPFELLDKIFQECLRSALPGLQAIDAKHTLIHTCGTWRAVIFNQAKFWTTLYIDIEVPVPYLRFLMQEALRVHQLLDVTVDTGDVDLTWTTTAAEEHPWVVETLIALGDAAEWFRDLSVMTSGQPSLALILRVVRVEQAMNLEHIRVALNRERFLHLPAPLVAVPSLHLTSFTIDTVIPVWEDTAFLSRIRTLRIGGLRMSLTWPRLRGVLKIAKNITSLGFYNLGCHPLPVLPRTVHLKELLEFELVFGHPVDLDIINLIFMPRLKTVKITGLPDAPWESLPVMCDSLLRAPSNLVITPGYGLQLPPSALHPSPVTYFLNIQGFPLQFTKDLFGNSGNSTLLFPSLRKVVVCRGVQESLIRSVAEHVGSTEVNVLEVLDAGHLPYNFRKWYIIDEKVENEKVIVNLDREML
ncbi:hypothetical protein R3P38DRAFT_2770624 [Favolaschia claudopus]|uniref:F-box domain-containing protein n=1 Tax=Favolaschia claudopus TaxID=2862362 RepID=A0AAW0CHN3_9AGAR